MKGKLYILCFALMMICSVQRTYAQAGKSEIELGYGYYSEYSLVNGKPFSASSGAPSLEYRYFINKNVTIGLGLGYENISTWGSFFTIAPEMTFCYLDTRHDRIRVRLYGAVAYGVAIFDDLTIKPGAADRSGPWLYGFQATPFGMRVGRQVAGFLEIGLGYQGLIHGGLSVRFPNVLKKHRREYEDANPASAN